MNSTNRSYQPFFRRGLAIMFLMLFLNGFITESFAYHFKDVTQSELIDFENEKDSEEDAKKEKEKENKILNGSAELVELDEKLLKQTCIHFSGLNEEIQEVLSPPPDLR